MELLKTISDLSKEFGTDEYVKGGGGNTSAKNRETLWVKPSGTTLAGLAPDSFVAIDRNKLSKLYDITPPEDSSKREALVKEIMMDARVGKELRPSVETPLHDSLNANFVVHTHPAKVNGLTCSKNAKSASQNLFPDALWVDYIDPGYTLCIEVRKKIKEYKQQNGAEPSIILMKNHGIFAAADTADQIRDIYARIFEKLESVYKEKNIPSELKVEDLKDSKEFKEDKKAVEDCLGNIFEFKSVSGPFDIANGPISPDHLVYSKSYPFTERPTKEAVEKFKETEGYYPKVVACESAVFGLGETQKKADLALKMAKDGAFIKQLAQAFGGIDYMSDKARAFIENWEVESYRSKQI